MVLRVCVVAVLVLLSIGACAPERVVHERVVHWQGQEFSEFDSLLALPASIRRELGTDAPGLQGVADKGQPFNATDAIVEIAPMRRFIIAGQAGDLWLVALEVGGFGYSIEVSQFSGGKMQKVWTLPDRPQTLEELLQQISSRKPHYSVDQSVVPAAPK